MPDRVIAETIDFSESEQYTLSIRLSTDGFSFSIYNPIHDSSLSFFKKEVEPSLSLTANLKKAFRELNFLNHTYKRVNILMVDKRFTLIPFELSEGDQSGMVFCHNHTPKENETIKYNILKKNNVVVIFGMDKSTYQFLSDRYPEARFYSQAAPLAEYFSAKSRLSNSKKTYASIRHNAIDSLCYGRGHPLPANSFECCRTGDRIYYLLYLWKQLNLNQERDELHLTGVFDDKEKLTQELRKYIQQVFITDPASNIDIRALLACE